METKERQAIVRQRMDETIKLDPTVPLSMGGRDFTLVFNNWAVKEILKETGLNLLTTPLLSEQMTDPTVIGPVLLCGLRTHSPELTLEEVDRLFTMRHLLYVQTKLAEALSLFYPDTEDLPKLPESEGEAIPT